MLILLSYAVGICIIIALTACVALGLLKICDFIEEHPSNARSVGRALTLTVIILSTIVTFTDDISYSYLLASWFAHLSALYTLQPKSWPFSTSPILLVASLLSPVLVHLSLVQHFHHATPVIERAHWPGGRQDWDTLETSKETGRLYGNGEALTCFALCWSPALWIALGAITQNWTLPLARGQSRRPASSKQRSR